MSSSVHWPSSLPSTARWTFTRQLPFACSAFIVVHLFATLTLPLASASESPVASSASSHHLPKNADLLAYKMYGDPEDEELGKPISDSLSASLFDSSSHSNRVQRHISPDGKPRRRHRKKRRRSQKGGFIPLPEKNTTAVRSFKELKPSASFSLGNAHPHLTSENGRGFCKTVPFTQWVNVTGCVPKRISNRYCYGACNSFYIPSDGHQFPPFTSCQGCTPKRFKWKTVELLCGGGSPPDLRGTQGDDDNRIIASDEASQQQYHSLGASSSVKKIYKQVQIVTKCKCSTIDVRA